MFWCRSLKMVLKAKFQAKRKERFKSKLRDKNLSEESLLIGNSTHIKVNVNPGLA